MKQGARILVVDDSIVNQTLLDGILGNEYELAFADTGLDAIALAQSFRPDVVLLDIVMPGIDGYETCRRLRSNLTLNHAKIILVSGRTEVTDRLEGYEAGADDYVTKPFDPEELLAKVKVFLRLKSVEELNQLKMSTLNLINHEARTPLNSIQCSLQILRMVDSLQADAVDELIDAALLSCERLTNLIEKSMLFNEFNAGSVHLELTPVAMDALIDDAIAEVQHAATERAVTINTDKVSVCRVDADRSFLTMLVKSLLENAIRFSAENGAVEVRIKETGDSLSLEVEDHGRGIDPSYLPYIFEAFVPHDISHHTRGQGLSLAIAREIVKEHGGEIKVTSTPGEATIFCVKLPIRVNQTDEIRRAAGES